MNVQISDRAAGVLAAIILALALVIAATLLGMLTTWALLGSPVLFFGFVPFFAAMAGGGVGFWALCKALNRMVYGKWI
jgi:hypothetical protein